jgi:hypothetical protein
VPYKRNVSKQRRQARNRPSRDALAARSGNAHVAPTTSSSKPTAASSTTRATSKADRATGAAGARGGGRPRPVMVAYEPAPAGLKGMLTSTRIGDRAVLLAFVVALVVAVVGLVTPSVAVDDRGEPLPSRFAGLTIEAREAITGQPVNDNTVNILDAYGAIGLMLVGTPVLICAFALWSNRRPDRARTLTFSLMALVAATILFPTAGMLAFAPVVALAVATFRVRKADLVAPEAQPAAAGAGRGATTTEDAPERPPSFLDRLLGGGAAGTGRTSAGTGKDDDVIDVELADGSSADAPTDATESDDAATDERDPLAALEAEIAAESETESDDASSGRGRRKG